MSRLLHVSASARGADSHSRRFGGQLVAALRRQRAFDVVERDLAADPLPYPGPAFLSASLMADRERNIADKAALAVSERLISELEEADAVVIDTPMHNFTVPAALKTWIDHVVRPNRTFMTTPEGKIGLLRDRPVYVVIACGGGFDAGAGGQEDHLTPYLLYILSTVGLRDVHALRLDRLRRGDEALARAGTLTEQWIGAILAGDDLETQH
ncbi:FMN-dependent NADH-azoreductase [Azospirillum sp. B506]|uniref:FMN-dependent NADH-azoreductase n=1 Tax=Azospirillum sp. B506 TaxID=137721 RepID=UPI00034CFD77|nr:NAD(P)H-dependent oxidoreductase [Azospirillum sp. B506]